MNSIDFSPIGFVQSCYQEKFGIPRQPSLVPSAKAQLILNNDFDESSVRGLADFSHIWVQFVFHETLAKGWKSMVRPPRLGGNTKVGVFASRSTFRPNAIGLSVVKLDQISFKKGKVVLHLSGHDLLNNTPVLDIKPYLPYADSQKDAQGAYARDKPEKCYEVIFCEEAEDQCLYHSKRLDVDLKHLIVEMLSIDPRPSYQQNGSDSKRKYAVKLYDFDLRWQYCENNKIKVLAITV